MQSFDFVSIVCRARSIARYFDDVTLFWNYKWKEERACVSVCMKRCFSNFQNEKLNKQSVALLTHAMAECHFQHSVHLLCCVYLYNQGCHQNRIAWNHISTTHRHTQNALAPVQGKLFFSSRLISFVSVSFAFLTLFLLLHEQFKLVPRLILLSQISVTLSLIHSFRLLAHSLFLKIHRINIEHEHA